MNAAWHKKNRLPRNASLDERIDWHKRHAENCGCRPMPASIRARLENPIAPAGPKKKTPKL
jgi:hypothetical protein